MEGDNESDRSRLGRELSGELWFSCAADWTRANRNSEVDKSRERAACLPFKGRNLRLGSLEDFKCSARRELFSS